MGWLRRLFRSSHEKRKLDAEIDRELAFHIEELIRENVATGMSPQEARRQAMISFGGERQTAEECQRARAIPWLDDLFQDLRFGWRMLLKSPAYTIAAILALSLGIGPNAALFTIFDAIALRPLPVPLSERIVEFGKATPLFPLPASSFTYSEFQYFRDHNTKFDGISAYIPSHLLMDVPGGSAEAVFGLYVSSDYLSVMRADPVFGNGFSSADDVQDAPPYPALLSENFWERRFGRDPAVLGKTMLFNGVPSVIVGLTPRDFTGPRAEVPDILISLAAREDPRRRLQDQNPCCILDGRLKPGVSFQDAALELKALTAALYSDRPGNSEQWTLSVGPARSGFALKGGPLIIIFGLLQTVIGSVLLIACANVAGLLLGKAISRRKEIAVRLALGAARGRLVRQLVTEALLIAQLAGLVSVLTSWWVLKVLLRIALSMIYEAGVSAGGTYLINVTPDLRVLAYALTISTLTAIGFALLPALQTTRLNLTEILNEDVPSLNPTGKPGLQGWPVMAQVAVCLTLLIVAGTLVSSSRHLFTTDPGFNPDHVLSMAIVDPVQLGYSTARVETVTQQVQARISSLPGITSIASASRLPLGGLVSRATVVPQSEGSASSPEQIRMLRYPFTFVSADYFETLGIGLLQGRGFTAQEISTQAPVAVISNALAAKLWPGKSAMGKAITIGSAPEPSTIIAQPFFPSVTVIGVARDVYSVGMMAPDPGAVYLPSPKGGLERILFIRTAKDPQTLVPLVSSELQSIDRNLAATFQTMNTVVEHDSAHIVLRTAGLIFSAVGLLGLLLASVGIYSMVGYAVSQQTREIGIRMAMGAHATDVQGMILRRSMRPIGIGVALGLVLGMIISLLMSRLSPGLRMVDPVVLVQIALLLIVVAACAAYVPARRATHIDPWVALRIQ